MPSCVCLPKINGFLQKEVAWGEEECLGQTASWSPMQFMGLTRFLLISGQHQGSSPSRVEICKIVRLSVPITGSLKKSHSFFVCLFSQYFFIWRTWGKIRQGRQQSGRLPYAGSDRWILQNLGIIWSESLTEIYSNLLLCHPTWERYWQPVESQ